MYETLDVREMQGLQDTARKASYPDMRSKVGWTHKLSQRLAALVGHNTIRSIELECFMNVDDVWIPNVSQNYKFMHGAGLDGPDLIGNTGFQYFDD